MPNRASQSRVSGIREREPGAKFRLTNGARRAKSAIGGRGPQIVSRPLSWGMEQYVRCRYQAPL